MPNPDPVRWDRKAPTHQQAGRKTAFRILVGIGLAGILVLAFLTFTDSSARGEALDEPPMAAQGSWTTRDARYQGRSLSVGPSEVVLALGDEAPDERGVIEEVRSWTEEGGTVVQIEYVTGDGPLVLEMILEAPDRMRLRNPSEVLWTRNAR